MNLKKAFDKEMSLLRYVAELWKYLILKKCIEWDEGVCVRRKELKYHKEFICLFTFGCTLKFYRHET